MMKKIYQLLFFKVFILSALHPGLAQKSEIIVTDRQVKGMVTFSETYTAGTFSDSRHVDGYVKKSGTAHFLFPVGHKGMYRPFAAQADAVCGAYYQQDPNISGTPGETIYQTGNKSADLLQVSNKEFWDIEGANATRITLTWNANSAIPALTGNQLEQLCITGWNLKNQRWEKMLSAVDGISVEGTATTLVKGSITTVAKIIPNDYSAFTFATTGTIVLAENFEGKLESVGCGNIRGWVWNKNKPDIVQVIEILVDGSVALTTTAGKQRQDLKNSGIGSGKYGFDLLPPPGLNDGTDHQISVRIKDTDYILSGSPMKVNCAYEGELQSIDCSGIKGWARNKNNLAEPVTLQLIQNDGAVVSEISTNAGNVENPYFYHIAFPDALKNGQPQQLSMRVKNTSFLFAATSRSITCTLPVYKGNFESGNCNKISGWIMDKSSPSSAVVIELMEGNSVLARSTANIFRQDVKNAGYGTGLYGFSIKTPVSLSDGMQHTVRIRVKDAGTFFGSAKIISCPAATTSGRLSAGPAFNDKPEINGQSDWTVEVSPNPATDILSIHFPLQNQQQARISLHNIAGNKVWEKEIFGNGRKFTGEIDVSHYPPGVYLVQVSIDSQSKSKRIVVIR